MPLSKVMQNVLFRYTRYWNARNRKIGHLFQGRYKAILCEKESYLLELIRYLHLNPVRSQIVRDPAEYSWSSHKAYLEGDGRGWIAVDRVLPWWGKGRRQAMARYQRFVREGLGDGHRADLYKVTDQRYLGDEGFVEGVEEKVLEREAVRLVEVKWEEVKEAVCNRFGLSGAAVMHRGRGREAARVRRIIAWVGREVGGFSNREMADALQLDPAALSRGLIKLADELGRDGELRTVTGNICDTLRSGKRPKRSIRSA